MSSRNMVGLRAFVIAALLATTHFAAFQFGSMSTGQTPVDNARPVVMIEQEEVEPETSPVLPEFDFIYPDELRLPPELTPPTTIEDGPAKPPFEARAPSWAPGGIAKAVDCLARNIYFEAKSESVKGQIAVGLVTINRVHSPRFPNTICDVVWQKRRNPVTNKMVAQFSWTLDGKSDNPVNKRAWLRAQRIANAMLSGGTLHHFVDFTGGATHYHATYVSPYWSRKLEKVFHEETHIFYTDGSIVADACCQPNSEQL